MKTLIIRCLQCKGDDEFWLKSADLDTFKVEISIKHL